MTREYHIKHMPSGWTRGPFKTLPLAQEAAKKLLAEKGGGKVDIILATKTTTFDAVETIS